MLVLIPILLLPIATLTILVLRRLRPRRAYAWLTFAGTSLLSLGAVLFARTQIQTIIPLTSWQPDILFPVSPAFILDQTSWLFASALMALLFSASFADIGRPNSDQADGPSWSTWSSSMLLATIALTAILAENILTLVLAWTAMDLAELIIRLSKSRDSRDSELAVINFSTHLGGTLVLIWAGIQGLPAGAGWSFTAISPELTPIILLSVGLRLGIVPPNITKTKYPSNNSLQVILPMASAAVNLPILVRNASAGAVLQPNALLIILACLAGLYGGIFWLRSSHSEAKLAYWILAVASMSFISAVRGQPEASLAWSMVLLLPGGMIHFHHTRRPRMIPILFFAFLGVSVLPFTPNWWGANLYTPPLSVFIPIFFLIQTLLVTAFIRHGLGSSAEMHERERWVWLVYPWGLIIPITLHFAIGWLLYNDAPLDLSWSTIWPGLISNVIAIGIVALAARNFRFPPSWSTSIARVISFQWAYRRLWNFYNLFRKLFSLVDRILEGQAGILWAILLLALILSLVTQASFGG